MTMIEKAKLTWFVIAWCWKNHDKWDLYEQQLEHDTTIMDPFKAV